MVFVDFYFVNKFNVKLWNIFFVRRSYLYKNINYIYFILLICMYVILLFVVDLIIMNICLLINILKRKLEYEYIKISYINKLFEFKIYINFNFLDKILRFLVRFWMDGRVVKLIFVNIV